MKKVLLSFLFIILCSLAYAQDLNTVYNYIKDKSTIKKGGTELFAYDGKQYLITVVSLVVGNKTEANCRTVGSAKAKRDMLSYVNGSEITSCTELINSENTSTDVSGTKTEFSQNFMESIRETVQGSINEISALGGWYSEDRLVYFFSIYKQVQL